MSYLFRDYQRDAVTATIATLRERPRAAVLQPESPAKPYSQARRSTYLLQIRGWV